MAQRISYSITFRTDAGLHRQWAAQTHGSVLRFGGSFEQWRRARHTVAALALQTGLSRAEITALLIADYTALDIVIATLQEHVNVNRG